MWICDATGLDHEIVDLANVGLLQERPHRRLKLTGDRATETSIGELHYLSVALVLLDDLCIDVSFGKVINRRSNLQVVFVVEDLVEQSCLACRRVQCDRAM